MKTLSFLIIAILMTSPLTRAGKVLFEEDFEAYPGGTKVLELENAKNEWNVSGFKNSGAQGQAFITENLGNRDSKAALTTPLNADGNESENTMNLTASFKNTEEDTRVSINVFPEAGSGQIYLRTAGGNPSEAMAKIYFKAYPSMQIMAMSGGASADSAEGTPIQIGNFKYGKWYRIQITLHPEKQNYDIEIFDMQSESSLGSTEGIDFSNPIYAFGNILVGSIFGEKSRFGWDDIKVETLK